MSFLNVNAVTAKTFFECEKLILSFFSSLLPRFVCVYIGIRVQKTSNGKEGTKEMANDSDSSDDNTPKSCTT